jgi:NosR/NirI family nitrous oxide reductase transcriptional regulator
MPRRTQNLLVVLFILLIILSNAFSVVERFPKPDFKSEYQRPLLTTPMPRSVTLEYLDVLVLLAALSLASYFALKLRSRKHIFLLTIFSVIYFGFWREGCVCPIGSIQNVAYALFESSYAIPITVILFFVLPLVFTLFYGRTFCAAVCPLGAVQDIVVLKHINVPRRLAETLSIFPYIYLGLAVLFAATGAGFVICQYDPFVGFFRFGADFNMIILGVSLLILGTVVARPYCRFICPYGVLLSWMSRLSRRHVTITPTECTNCRLCEESCPFGAIEKPQILPVPEPGRKDLRRLSLLLLLLPLVIAGSGWLVSNLYIPLSRQHAVVSLAEEIIMEDSGQRTETTLETRTFRASGKPTEELINEARNIQGRFKISGWILGGFLGLIFCLKLIKLIRHRKPLEYSTDTGNCLSCARCFNYCPFEQERIASSNRTSIFNEF